MKVIDLVEKALHTDGGITPEELSHQLRDESGSFLSERRQIVACSLIAAGSMSMITLYQMGLISHLPEPSLPYLDADKVDAAKEAYAKLSAPDAAIGLVSYAATALLATVGEKDRARREPWLPLLLAAKVSGDTLQALNLTRSQWTKHKAFCSWCLLATGATLGTVRPAFKEAAAAVKALLKS